MCTEERRICKTLDETSLGDHQFLTRTPANLSVGGYGEELYFQSSSLEARAYEGQLESRYTYYHWRDHSMS